MNETASQPLNPKTLTRDDYFKLFAALTGYELENSKSLDTLLITISSAAIGLSVAIANQHSITQCASGVLVTIWVLFGATIVANLFSYVVASKSFAHQHRVFSSSYLQQIPIDIADWASPNKHAQKVIWLNRSAIVTFILGLVSLLFFAQLNLTIMSSHEHQESGNSDRHNKQSIQEKAMHSLTTPFASQPINATPSQPKVVDPALPPAATPTAEETPRVITPAENPAPSNEAQAAVEQSKSAGE